MFAPFHYAFVQRGMLEALLLSIPAGILGTWIVLRGLAFFSHAVGTAAFPGLVLAAGLGWPGPAGAAVAVTAYTLGVESLASRRESNRETTTGLLLVGSLAACFARLPRSERKLVTDHDAFGYFTHRYGLDVVGAVIPSQTTQAQPSAGATARLVRLIRREHVRAVFPESSVNRRVADTIARETGATSRYTLYGDTLGPAGSPGATYLGMERANADAIVRGLSGGRLRCAP